MPIQWDADQERALDLLLSDHDRHAPGRLGGWAGTGKTAVLAEACRRDPRIVVLTPTHRARLALAAAGIDRAATIHSAIYQPVEPRDVEAVRSDITATQASLLDLAEGSAEASIERGRLQALQTELDRDVEFVPRGLDGTLEGERVIIDEASMVGGQLLEDVVTHGRPRSLCLVGDPAQLPPVQDSDPFRAAEPDVQLTRVYRHDGWILDCATAVREGREDDARAIAHERGRLKPHRDGRGVARALRESRESAESTIEICWRRRTRWARNRRAVELVGDAEWGRRVCCERSHHATAYRSDDKRPRNGTLGWLRGGVLTSDAGYTVRDTSDRAIAWAEDLPDVTREHVRDRWLWAGGYAVTCHRAQGAQWKTVSVIDEYDRSDGRDRWLYTALTRAQEDLVWWTV